MFGEALKLINKVFGWLGRDKTTDKYVEHKNELQNSDILSPDELDDKLRLSNEERKASKKYNR